MKSVCIHAYVLSPMYGRQSLFQRCNLTKLNFTFELSFFLLFFPLKYCGFKTIFTFGICQDRKKYIVQWHLDFKLHKNFELITNGTVPIVSTRKKQSVFYCKKENKLWKNMIFIANKYGFEEKNDFSWFSFSERCLAFKRYPIRSHLLCFISRGTGNLFIDSYWTVQILEIIEEKFIIY